MLRQQKRCAVAWVISISTTSNARRTCTSTLTRRCCPLRPKPIFVPRQPKPRGWITPCCLLSGTPTRRETLIIISSLAKSGPVASSIIFSRPAADTLSHAYPHRDGRSSLVGEQRHRRGQGTEPQRCGEY